MKSGGWVVSGQDGVDIEEAQRCLLVLVCDINYKKKYESVFLYKQFVPAFVNETTILKKPLLIKSKVTKPNLYD